MASDSFIEYQEKYNLENVKPEVFKAYAVMAISQLEWDVVLINDLKIIAQTRPIVNSFCKQISIDEDFAL